MSQPDYAQEAQDALDQLGELFRTTTVENADAEFAHWVYTNLDVISRGLETLRNDQASRT